MSTSTTAAPGTGVTAWSLDPAHTLVEFSARHMMITTVKGRVSGVTGTIHVDDRDPARSEVSAELDAATIDTRTEARDQHLRSADFLDVENHPSISFRSRRVEGTFRNPGDRFRLHGELTLRGVARPVTLDVVYEGAGQDPWGGSRASFSASGTFDRRDFGLTWNAALEAGGVLVSNDIRLSIEAQAIREG
jgi:polyisoprenoid-binding protein YceI